MSPADMQHRLNGRFKRVMESLTRRRSGGNGSGFVSKNSALSRGAPDPYIDGQDGQDKPPAGYAMIDGVYNKRILELAADIPRLGRLADPQGSATAHSRLCGSTITVDLSLEEGKVCEFAQELKACALGQASASILARHILGATPGELRALRETMRKMLKENGPPPDGRWADLSALEPVRDYKARHASTLLPFDAVVGALDKIEGAGPA